MDHLLYNGQQITFDDWVFEQFEQMDLDEIGEGLEPQIMAAQYTALLAKAVDLAIANGGSLAGVSPSFETEDGSAAPTRTESASQESDDEVLLFLANQPPVANDDGTYNVAWNKVFVVPDAHSNDLLSNDTDSDGPMPLRAFKVTDPAHGTVTVTENGGFTYMPHTGYVGMDSFTYEAYDGLDYSAPATVNIRVISMNVSIADAQTGNTLPEEPAPNNETTRGAFTVANYNDTDADGFPDISDTDVLAGGPALGDDEEDLMEVWIHRPSYVPSGMNPMVMVAWSGVKLWTHSHKHGAVGPPGMSSMMVPTSQLPMRVWAEATTKSTSLRDLNITAGYSIPDIWGQSAQDEVRATGIWTTFSTSRHDVPTIGQAAFWAQFPDIEDPPKGIIDIYHGPGLKPIPAGGGPVIAVILMQFEVKPARPIDEWEDDGVFFDGARQKEMRAWRKSTSTSAWTLDPAESEDFPDGDVANDDGREDDESGRVTSGSHVYTVDTPGWTAHAPTGHALASRRNYFEFIRVGIGINPLGNNDDGSRASDKYKWHYADKLLKDATAGSWKRDPNDNEVDGVNSIGKDHHPLAPPP